MTKAQAMSGSAVRSLIESAEKGAEEAKKANYINISDDGTEVVLTTVIQGQALAWIAYNGHQLDHLIALLETHRAKLKPSA